MNTYEIHYKKTNRTFTYADLDPEVLVTLEDIEPEEMFVLDQTAELIRLTLGLAKATDEELTYIRNAVVHHFAEKIDLGRTRAQMASQKGAACEALRQAAYDDGTRMSMITAVIDNEKFARGLAV